MVNPSPYMYYLDFDGLVVAGASPEMMTRTEGGTIETRPIAGTRPRGRTPEEDAAWPPSSSPTKKNAPST